MLPIVVSVALELTSFPSAPEPQPVVGGNEALACDFPADVFIGNGGANCTASLVHPRVLITAGHCLGGISMAGFGESAYSPAMTMGVEWCDAHPDYYQWGLDLAVCVLAQDAPAVAMVPVIMGCEAEQLTEGHDVVIAGFGMSDEASGTGGGIKRFTTNTIDYLSYEANQIYLLGNANGSCFGDSGGPAYMQLDDGTWRVIAAVQGPHPQAPPLGCGYGGTYTLIHPEMAWIESVTGYDVTPCFDADGTWNPDARCTELPMQLQGAGGSWASMCEGAPLSGPGESCGAAHPDLDPGDATTGGESGEADDGGLDGHEPPDATTGHEPVTDSGVEPETSSDDGGSEDDAAAIDDDWDPALPPTYGHRRRASVCRVGDASPPPIFVLCLLAIGITRARGSARRDPPAGTTR